MRCLYIACVYLHRFVCVRGSHDNTQTGSGTAGAAVRATHTPTVTHKGGYRCRNHASTSHVRPADGGEVVFSRFASAHATFVSQPPPQTTGVAHTQTHRPKHTTLHTRVSHTLTLSEPEHKYANPPWHDNTFVHFFRKHGSQSCRRRSRLVLTQEGESGASSWWRLSFYCCEERNNGRAACDTHSQNSPALFLNAGKYCFYSGSMQPAALCLSVWLQMQLHVVEADYSIFRTEMFREAAVVRPHRWETTETLLWFPSRATFCLNDDTRPLRPGGCLGTSADLVLLSSTTPRETITNRHDSQPSGPTIRTSHQPSEPTMRPNHQPSEPAINHQNQPGYPTINHQNQ